MERKNTGLILAILFSSIILSGSLVFFGVRLSAQNETLSDADIEAGIENYVLKQQEAQRQVGDAEAIGKNALAQNVKPVSRADDHIRGDVNAKISLIEFSDFECPFCKRFHPTAQQVIDEYDGQVNWVYRHFPLSFHDPLATKEALAAECAADQGGNEAFWAMADLLFERTTSNGTGLDSNNLGDFAEEIGLSKQLFDECMESEKFKDRIQQDINDGSNAGVTGTPGNILINNETGETILIEGAQPFSMFQQSINTMLRNSQ